MSDESVTAGASWSIMDRTLELLAVHCGTVAYEEPGGWECASCGDFTESRNIPGWAEGRAALAARRSSDGG
ncbi:hypothetical protein BX265_2329 [Streptomyces sp. TLI_235]|nr:hypothetical protein [Streptomyces sp. TLI_235]PBC77578.1 hypothetical protein BX265_2329 [Streptomyces sp. TLI_235]